MHLGDIAEHPQGTAPQPEHVSVNAWSGSTQRPFNEDSHGKASISLQQASHWLQGASMHLGIHLMIAALFR
jgi:hypothetical protein